MPAPFPQAREGAVATNHPTGFPLFFDRRKPRVITADPWAFLRRLATAELPQEQERIALAYIEQARDFCQAAENPMLGSKPLLYYYSFLNLAKAALVLRDVPMPAAAKHGITDPKLNTRTRLRFEGQKVRMRPVAPDHSEVFPELVQLFGGGASEPRDLKVLDLLYQIPSLHRVFTRVTGWPIIFVPIKRMEVRHSRGEWWTRVVLSDSDQDVTQTLRRLRKRRDFEQLLFQVVSEERGEVWFETPSRPGERRWADRAIQTLSKDFRDLGTVGVLTRTGYRFYFSALPKAERFPAMAAAYAVLFYLGSVTRYKPDVFDKLVAGGYAWIVHELLAVQPVQFIYALASELAGVDVVKPQCDLR